MSSGAKERRKTNKSLEFITEEKFFSWTKSLNRSRKLDYDSTMREPHRFWWSSMVDCTWRKGMSELASESFKLINCISWKVLKVVRKFYKVKINVQNFLLRNIIRFLSRPIASQFLLILLRLWWFIGLLGRHFLDYITFYLSSSFWVQFYASRVTTIPTSRPKKNACSRKAENRNKKRRFNASREKFITSLDPMAEFVLCLPSARTI